MTESIADGRRLSSSSQRRVQLWSSSIHFGFCSAGNTGGIMRLVILTSFESLCLHVLGLFFPVLLISYGCWFSPSWSSSKPGFKNLELCTSNRFKKFPQERRHLSKTPTALERWLRKQFVALENCHVENMLYLYNKEINVVEFHLFTLACDLSHLNSALVCTEMLQI